MIRRKMVKREMMKVLLMMIVEKEMIKEMIIFKIKIIEIILEAEFCRMRIMMIVEMEVGMM